MTTPEKKQIRSKLGLLELARQLGNVSQASACPGYSCDVFYRFNGYRLCGSSRIEGASSAAIARIMAS